VAGFTERGGWWVVAQFVLFALYAGALVATEPVSEGVGLGFARAVGLVLAVLGAGVGAWAVALHRFRVSPFPAPGDEASLVTGGPYRWVRHPIYSAVIAVALGAALWGLRPAAVLVAVAFVPFFMAKTGHEEALLEERYPAYRDYRSRVRWRLVPGLL